MKNFKKILVLALAVMMCLTALAVPTFAATFNPEVKITVRFNDDGDRIIASVVTAKETGAIQGTLTFDGLTFDAENTKFTEINDQRKYVEQENAIKFVLLANDLTKGDTHWADFYFEVPKSTGVTFGLKDVKACDINETLADAVSVNPVALTLSENDLRTLGAQYRAAADNVSPALRFGTRLDRNQETNALSEGKTAVRCGFLAGFEFKVKGAELAATIDDEGKITGVTKGAINKQAKYCLSTANDHMIYTYAVTGIEEDSKVNTGEAEEYVKDLNIVVRPYVIYQNADSTYGIDYGTQVSKCYSDVQAASGLLDATLGYK